VRGACRVLGRLTWARQLASCHACSAGRARLRGAWASARRGCRGTVAGPALGCGATWPVSGEGASASPGPRRRRTAKSTPAGSGTPRRADGATSRPERAVAQERFKVALFDWFKQ
jgi:hypothetical protein